MVRFADSMYNADLQIFFWCQGKRCSKTLVFIARQFSRSADGHLYLAIGMLALLHQHYSFVWLAINAVAIERVLYFLTKKGFRRNRPPDIIPGFKSVIRASDKFSFPSGHTSAAFLMSTAATLYFPPLAWILFSWSALVAWSRVMLGLHFPGDTIAGALLGTVVTLVTFHSLIIM